MSNEVKNGVLIGVVTSICLSMITGAGLFIKSELEEYQVLKESLPQIHELNEVRKALEKEYIDNKKATNTELWNLKQNLKELKLLHLKDCEEIRKKRATDSSFIYYNYHYVNKWLNVE